MYNMVPRNCPFIQKVRIAEQAGAKAVIIFDNNQSEDEIMLDMIKEAHDPNTAIHSYFLKGKDGLVRVGLYWVFVSLNYLI